MSYNQEALIDILEAIKLILQYAKGLDFDGLANNVEKQDAILLPSTLPSGKPLHVYITSPG